ncbi:unnamed protein product [Paramecium pentaurelia]|uniref:PX domain-containing protein n=1 Tax=Paramecium pentaurelia TaxID=43138 RepID=A0A8S1TFQ4_9CILI|nr:unnamed protein product [Paramecium pentaurelia]
MQNNIIEQNKIVVRVKDPTINQNQEEFVIYNIEGQDNTGNFQIQHRFSEFYQLRSLLALKWQYCYIPALPPKVIQGNMSLQVIYQRLIMLNHFMKQLSHFSFLWYSQEVQTFLRQQYIKESNSNEQQENYANLLISIFPDFAENIIDQEIETKINQFYLFIQNATPILQNYKILMKNQINVSKYYFEQINIFQTYFIPEYEKILEINVENFRSRQTSKIFQNDQNNCILNDTDKLKLNQMNFKFQLSQFKKEINQNYRYKLQMNNSKNKLTMYLKFKIMAQIQLNNYQLQKKMKLKNHYLIQNKKRIDNESFSLFPYYKQIRFRYQVFEKEFFRKLLFCSQRNEQIFQIKCNITYYQNLLQQIEKQEF